MSQDEEFLTWMHDYRGVEVPCRACGGSGVRTYGSTSTWRGGVGGQTITSGVCDKCWGSGDAQHIWPSHRLLMQKVYDYDQAPTDPRHGGKLTAEQASTRLADLETENNKLRSMLAKSSADCPYCGLPAADIARCAHGFPGCGRADDMLIESD